MEKECAICDEEIEEIDGKILGAMLKIVENKKKSWIYVCSECQSANKDKDSWIEKAKIRAA